MEKDQFIAIHLGMKWLLWHQKKIVPLSQGKPQFEEWKGQSLEM